MVEVGDTVIVAPLDGQKDKMAVVTGPAGAGAVLNEGNYNTWTHEWTNDFPDGLYGNQYQDHYIDDKNNILYFAWSDGSAKVRLGLFNLSDFSSVFLSPSGSHYQNRPYHASNNFNFGSGLAMTTYPHSIQTYILLGRYDDMTMEVWRGGAAYLWSHNIQTEIAADYLYTFSISPTGKYILVVTYYEKIVLYKGSYVEP